MAQILVISLPTSALELDLEEVFSGLGVPVSVTHTGDARIFVTFLDGRVLIVENGSVSGQPFLDITDRTLGDGRGLWSIGFHPRYQENGYVFAHYAEVDTGDSIISRFRLSDDPNELDESSEAVLLRMPKTNQVHYGGQLRFGPDGYLYASTGDSTGRSGGPDPGCVAQSPDSLEGKILRLDVDQGSDAPPFHTSPDDNPFVDSGRPEVWALGLRNPWRFSFDPEGGDLWISDVGHERREEMNFLHASTPGGANFGWKVM